MQQPVSCLLAVDLQEGFISDRTAAVPDAVRRFCDSHQIEQRVFTRFINPGGGPLARAMGCGRRMSSSPEIDLAEEVASLPTLTVDKCACSPFRHTPLEGHLRNMKASEVMVCGVDTDASVLASALGLLDRGFRPVVISDLCGSGAGDRAHAEAIRLMARRIGRRQTITSAEAAERLARA